MSMSVNRVEVGYEPMTQSSAIELADAPSEPHENAIHRRLEYRFMRAAISIVSFAGLATVLYFDDVTPLVKWPAACSLATLTFAAPLVLPDTCKKIARAAVGILMTAGMGLAAAALHVARGEHQTFGFESTLLLTSWIPGFMMAIGKGGQNLRPICCR